MTTYLKVLGPENRACHGGAFDYADYLPQGDEPGPWLPERTSIICETGWHWCTPESLMGYWAKEHMRVYVAEPSGDVTGLTDDGKCVSSSGRLLREYPLPEWWTEAMRFVREELPNVPWMQRVGPVDPAWRVFPSRDAAQDAARYVAWDAARYAVWAAARYVAWDAAQDAAWGAAWDAARDAARVAAWYSARYVAWDAARDAAQDAARYVAWDAARDAAQDAARDASLYATVRYICDGLPLAHEHRDHAAARWEVWRRGYGVLCDVDGVLYVYEAVN